MVVIKSFSVIEEWEEGGRKKRQQYGRNYHARSAAEQMCEMVKADNAKYNRKRAVRVQENRGVDDIN